MIDSELSKSVTAFAPPEGNVLFNNALNTFYLWSYAIRHVLKDHSDSERKPAATTTWAQFSD